MTGRLRLLLAAGIGAVFVLVVVLVWFQPQKLLIDEKVDEALPAVKVTTAATTETEAGPATEAGTQTESGTAKTGELARGEFVSLDHGTSGVARVLDVGDGSRVVRLEGLATDNGPDLYLYLSTNPTDGDEGAFDDEFVSLGRLKGNQGDQNYDVPADVDLARYSSVVIWCDRFNSAFGAAAIV